MTVNLLVTELEDFIKSKLDELWQKTDDGTWRAPNVLVGALPPKNFDEDGNEIRDRDFPFVLIRPTVITDDEEKSDVRISLVYGAYMSEADFKSGYMELLNISERTRQALLSLPFGVLPSQRFQLERELKTIIGGKDERQAFPFLLGKTETRWVMQAMIPGGEGEFYGSGY